MSQSLAQWLRVLRQAPALGGGRWRRLPGTLLVWRDAAPFVRIHFLAVATDLGLLEELRRRPATVDQLSDRLAIGNPALLDAFLRLGVERIQQRRVADGQAVAELVDGRRSAAQLLQQTKVGGHGQEVDAHKRGGIPPDQQGAGQTAPASTAQGGRRPQDTQPLRQRLAHRHDLPSRGDREKSRWLDAFLPILRDAAWPVWGAVGHRRRDLRRCSYPAAGRTSSTALPFTRRPSSACAASATCSHAPRQPTSTASLLP